MTKKLKESETRVIKRSQIKFAPYNPKNHTQQSVKDMLKNFKRIAFAGGVVWNALSGNLIDGHKRVMAQDIYYKYDGTPETDYEIKVEVLELDEKTEKEQNIWHTRSRSELDDELMRNLIPEIDYENAGLDDYDLSYYGIELNAEESESVVEAIEELYEPVKQQKEAEKEISKEEKKAKIKETKQKIMEDAQEKAKNLDSYVTLSFDNWKNKEAFMIRMGFDPEFKMIKGETLSEMVERIG